MPTDSRDIDPSGRAGFVQRLRDIDPSGRAGFVQRLREVAGLMGGVQKLADAAGVAASSAHDWFQRAEPRRNALSRIASAAEVSLDWLMLGGNYARLPFYDLRKSPYVEYFFNREARPIERRMFDLSMLVETDLARKQLENRENLTLRTWLDPVRAPRNLFMVLVDGCGDKMQPLICDGDVIVAFQTSGSEADYKPEPGHSLTCPYVISHRGKIIIRLIRWSARSTAVGPIEKSSWPPKMGEPEYTLKGIAPAPPIGEFFPIGRVIWCGRSLLSLDFS